MIDARLLKGAAHITGGGITDNTPRILPDGLAARVDVSSWSIPPFFEELRAIGNLDVADYRRTFNLGVGMILVLAKRNLGRARALLSSLGEACFQMGEVVESRGPRVSTWVVTVKRLGILLSGRGSNFEAIAENIGRKAERGDRGGDLESRGSPWD